MCVCVHRKNLGRLNGLDAKRWSSSHSRDWDVDPVSCAVLSYIKLIKYRVLLKHKHKFNYQINYVNNTRRLDILERLDDEEDDDDSPRSYMLVARLRRPRNDCWKKIYMILLIIYIYNTKSLQNVGNAIICINNINIYIPHYCGSIMRAPIEELIPGSYGHQVNPVLYIKIVWVWEISSNLFI